MRKAEAEQKLEAGELPICKGSVIRITDDNIGGDKMAELTIRRAEPKDAEAIEDLEQICFSQPWSYEFVIYYDIAENTKCLCIWWPK